MVKDTVCWTEPFMTIAQETSCAESPPCTHLLCFEHVKCLVAATVAPVILGCRSPERELYCICPPRTGFYHARRPTKMSISTTTAHIMTDFVSNSSVVVEEAAKKSGGISGGAVAGIVIGILAFLIIVSIGIYFTLRFMKDRRKNHGEYRPQFEEQHHAKDLPYLQPPAIEGLI